MYNDKRLFYLGDGAYAEYSGYDVRLFTERETTHEIFLDLAMLKRLMTWITKVQQQVITKGGNQNG